MRDLTLPDVNPDFAVLGADYLVDSGLFDNLLGRVGRALSGVPARVVSWLGPDVKTPANSHPPSVTIPEAGPWNGLIFVEADEASYWLLVRAGPGRARPDPRTISGPNGAHGQGRTWDGSPLSRVNWPDDPAANDRLPWDPEPWRR